MTTGPAEIVVGRITAPQGLAGEVRVEPLTDFPERFRPGLRLFVEHPPGTGSGRWTTVRSVRRHRGLLVMALEGVENREAAEVLRQALLRVPYTQRHPLPRDTFYVHDLVNLEVVDSRGRRVGRVSTVHSGPANDVIEVVRDGRTALIPAVRRFVTIDLDSGRVVVDPIPGMLDDLGGVEDSCESTS